MRRRDFVKVIAGWVAAEPFVAHAQEASLPVVGFLSGTSPRDITRLVEAFRLGLNDSGNVEGWNMLVEYRWAQGHSDQLPALAAQLANRRVAVIVAVGGIPSALAAMR